MELKKNNFLTHLVTFITSCTFLMFVLFLFKTFNWGLAYKNITSILKASLLFGLLNVCVTYLSSLFIAYRAKKLLQGIREMNTSSLYKILLTKLLIEFILSGLAIWLSVGVFGNEIFISNKWKIILIIILTIVLKGIFNLIISYQQNKDKIGGMR